MYRRWQLWLGIPALALATLLFTTSSASAQRWGRGGWGNGNIANFGNTGYGMGYYPGQGFGLNNWNNGYYGNGYYGNGYYGNGYYGNGYGRGYWSSPNYASGGYADYEPNYYYGQQPYYQQQGYTSFYPQQHEMPHNAAMVHVHLPRNADLWFGGDKTTQTGSERDFVTPELKGDKDYFYTLKARWTDQDGKQVERTRRVKVHANAHAMVDFFRNDQSTDTGERREPTATTPERISPTTNPPPVRDTTKPAPRVAPPAPSNIP